MNELKWLVVEVESGVGAFNKEGPGRKDHRLDLLKDGKAQADKSGWLPFSFILQRVLSIGGF